VGSHAFEITAALREQTEGEATAFPTQLPPEMAGLLRASLTRPLGPAARPFESHLRAGKNNTAYRAHSYHTKVPPRGTRAN
jgi:hypothetical protein